LPITAQRSLTGSSAQSQLSPKSHLTHICETGSNKTDVHSCF